MALQEAPVPGLDCKLYYNSATHASPTWVEITRAIDTNWSIDVDEADQSSRSSRFKKSNTAQVGIELSFTYRKKQGTDTVFAALQAAAIAGTAMEFWMADAASTETGAQGPRAYCKVFAMGGAQALANAEEVDFTCKPTYFEVTGTELDPDWYKVT